MFTKRTQKRRAATEKKRRTTRVAAILLAFLLCFSACFLPKTAYAASEKEQAPFVFDSGLVYRVDDSGEAALVASEKDIQSAAVSGSVSLGGKKYAVTSVASGAFANRGSLVSVTLPDTVKAVGDRAFFGCTSLESVRADGLEKSGVEAFTGAPFVCDDEFEILGKVLLKYNGSDDVVRVPVGVLYISDAFAYNETCVTVIVPEGVLAVGDGAFAMAESLENVSLPFSLESIGNSAFFGCVSLEAVSVCSNVREVGREAFSGTSYMAALSEAGGDFLILGDGVLVKYLGTDADITVPRGVKYISDAFAYNQCVETVTLPESVVAVGDGAFECSSLRRVVFEGNVTAIGDRAFAGCASLRCAVFDKDAPSVIGNKAFSGLSPAFAAYYRSGADGFEIFDEIKVPAFGS